MARPRRCRRICSEPIYDRFVSEGSISSEQIQLTLDEYETIRLMDLEHYTHEQCAKQMEISRTTVTEIYESARHKIADSLIHGKPLIISGGHYRLCDGTAAFCSGKVCRRHQLPHSEQPIPDKGATIMRIAVTYENGQIFQHFGHTEQFKIYDIEDGKVTESFVLDTNGQGHGALAGFLKEAKADILICGGIGGGAQNALAQAGIQLFGGVKGDADEAVAAYLGGNLGYNPNVHCDHHDHNHGEGHTCGDHHHGEGHSCGHGHCH